MLDTTYTPRSERTTRPPPSNRASVPFIVLYEAHGHVMNGVHDRLVAAGLCVRREQRFREVAPWLLRHADAIVVAVLPPWDTFRRSTLQAIRRLRPRAPLIAIVPATTPDTLADLAAAAASCILTTDAEPCEVVKAVHAVADSRVSQPPVSFSGDTIPPMLWT